VGAATAVLIVLGIVFAFEVLQESIGQAAASVERAAPGPAYDVNRSLKGDRLPAIVVPEGVGQSGAQVPGNPAPSAPKARLQDGCETAVSAIIRSQAPRAARCVT
jgi:hypothetical protein